MEKLLKTMARVTLLFAVSLGLAWIALALWVEKNPQSFELWTDWASGLPKWLQAHFGVTGRFGVATRLIITGSSVIVLMVLLLSRTFVAGAYSIAMRAYGPVLRAACFYILAALFAKASLIVGAASYPDSFNQFFDWADDWMKSFRGNIATTDVFILALKKVILDAKALMVITLTLVWRLLFSVAAGLVGVNDSEVVEVPAHVSLPRPPVASRQSAEAKVEIIPSSPHLHAVQGAPKWTKPSQSEGSLSRRVENAKPK